MHGGDYSEYKTWLKPLYKSVQTNIIYTAVAMDLDVVVDSTGLKKNTRDRFRAIAKSLDVCCNLIVFRGGRFLGAEDGDRRFESGPRGLTREAWQNVGIRHQKEHDPIVYPDGFYGHGETFDKILHEAWK